MKVFISWSGDLSHKVALVLRDWLPSVIQSVYPYVSSEDIDKGARWSTDVSAELQESNFGIICVTKDNVEAPWVNFEAGALSKSVDSSRVSPFLFGLKRSDIKTGPLLQFQSTLADAGDVQRLLMSINSSNTPLLLEESRLLNVFGVWWPQLEAKLEEISREYDEKDGASSGAKDLGNEVSDILEELLDLSRQQNRIINSPQSLLPPGYIREILADERMLDRGHPVFRDLEERWVQVISTLSTLPEGAQISGEIAMDLVRKLEGPIEYIFRNYVHRRRRFPTVRNRSDEDSEI